MHRISKAIVERALARCEASRGSVSVLRALRADGIPESVGGRWIGEGEQLLRTGRHPDRAACGTASCDEVLELSGKGAAGRGLVGLGNGPACPGCGGRSWVVPSGEELLKMKLARADTRTSMSLLEEAGRALGAILTDTEAENRANRLKAAIHVQRALDPDRYGEKRTVRHEGTIGLAAREAWAVSLTAEQVDALSPAAVESLRQIAELQRMLDEQARLVVTADLEGRVHRPALPAAPLT